MHTGTMHTGTMHTGTLRTINTKKRTNGEISTVIVSKRWCSDENFVNPNYIALRCNVLL